MITVDPVHLLLRTTFGVTPEMLADARRNPGYWIDRQLSPASIDDSVCDAVVQRFPLYAADPPELHTRLSYGSWNAMQDTVTASFVRACFSKRQLLEVMVEFWSNHLNTTAPSDAVWSGKGWEDRNVIRKHALGSFSDMLVASARSPAMLQYLDNHNSRGAAPNENYGRELLELHTVGRDAGYGQAGVLDCARAMTGRSTWTPWNGGTAETNGTFRYRPEWHDTGPLKVLGWSSANASAADGLAVGDSLLRYLAKHPATARRIATKLAVRFVSDTPPASLVDRLTASYLATGGKTMDLLKTLFRSPEFAASAGQKQRRPFEDVVATLRALDIRPSTDTQTKSFRDLVWELGQIGQAPFGWHPPDGYPDVAAAWNGTGTVLGRWNLHVGLAGGWWKNGLVYPGDTLVTRLLGARTFASRTELVTALSARLMPGTVLPAAHRDALVTFLGGPGTLTRWDTDNGQFSVLTALLLDSPHWSAR